MKILPFRGTSSPEKYLEWAQRVEKIFKCQDHTKASKVKLAALEFTDYANLWWENVKSQKRRKGEKPVTTWHLMKRLIEKRFVPQYYKQELFIKMQTLRQGVFCVEDYVKEFEMLMIIVTFKSLKNKPLLTLLVVCIEKLQMRWSCSLM